jgi:hypothetical protein
MSYKPLMATTKPKKKENRGGAREGAGRTSIGAAPGVNKTIRIAPDLQQRIKDQSAGKDFSEVVREALEEWLVAHKPEN